MMLASPSSDYISLRPRDSSLSPSCRGSVQHRSFFSSNSTPPRHGATRSTSYDSPMLTPSPLRRKPLFPSSRASDTDDDDDIFLQPPSREPKRTMAQPVADEDEGGLFLAPPSNRPFPMSSAQPLRTPVKQQSRRKPSLSYLSAAPQPVPRLQQSKLPAAPLTFGGTKRKGTSHDFSTPLRTRLVTPLGVSSAQNAGTSGVSFERLAPLAAPKFDARTPKSKVDTEVYMHKHTESMTHLRICDLDSSDEEEEESEERTELFSQAKRPTTGKMGKKPSLRESLLAMAKNAGKDDGGRAVKNEEVAEAISPGGHITKRRARSRPVSLELLESVRNTPSPSPVAPPRPPVTSRSTLAMPAPISFPSLTQPQPQRAQTSPAKSGLPRRRISDHAQPRVFAPKPAQPRLFPPPPPTPAPAPAAAPSGEMFPPRVPMARLASSATLFFGPAIPAASTSTASPQKSPLRVNTSVTRSAKRQTPRPLFSAKRTLANRHSYAGTRLGGAESPSPRSCLSDSESTHIIDTDEDDEFESMFGAPPESSFMFSVIENTPSPRSRGRASSGGLTSKYKQRDSGISLSDEEVPSSVGNGGMEFGRGTMGSSSSMLMPPASTSVNSLYSDVDAELVTPGAGPEPQSGWPGALIFEGEGAEGEGDGVDAFIRRTLAAGTRAPKERRDSESGAKRVPGTPKKMKTSHLSDGARPWQSAVAAKIATDAFGLDIPAAKKGAPRKSMPAAFPRAGADTDSEDEDDSPSFRKRVQYGGLGMGKPSAVGGGGGPFSKSRWLMRRSSSGIFSSGSDLSISTPTKLKASPKWKASASRIPQRFAPSNVVQFTAGGERSASGSSTSSQATLNSPSNHRHLGVSTTPKPTARRPQASPVQFTEEMRGRLETDFVEDDEVGSGEFGKVLKVRYQDGRPGVFAVKKSKPFEGVRHRMRLREEVEVLQHLSQVSLQHGNAKQPNVLAYIDSWEQDETLYIQTELCELGNFARFLWEYGRAFPRLDEARVWKIFADLSNGLQFIHEAGVIHLDIKPENIFVTSEGRFKIGDFGMASLWPRKQCKAIGSFDGLGAFEREGDKVYLAPEILQGQYGKEADIFSLGITMLETASNIVVPDQGYAWHQLRQEDFSQVDLDGSPELLALIKSMMRTYPSQRVDIQTISAHPVISRARSVMERAFAEATINGESPFLASPLAAVPDSFLSDILGHSTMLLDDSPMDLSL